MDNDKSDKSIGIVAKLIRHLAFNEKIPGLSPGGPILFIIIIIFLFYNCSKPSEDIPNNKVKSCKVYYRVANKDSICVYWDKVYNFVDTITHYELFYHSNMDTNWISIKNLIPVSDSPHVIVYRNDLSMEDSIFFLGVKCITEDGVSSDMHSCLDTTANPPMWGLIWKIP